jgi:flagellar hook protein FlgE
MASLSSTFNAAVSGAQGYGARMAANGQNLANVGVYGSKFHDVYLLSVNPSTSASSFFPGGVQYQNVEYVNQQGSPEASQIATHMAIQGAGMFVTNTQANDQGAFQFTRNGTFAPDQNGNWANAAGQFLQYVPTNFAGVPLNSSYTSTLGLATLNSTTVGNANWSPTANVNLNFNLPANAAINTVETIAIPGVIDALGNPHTLLMNATLVNVNTTANTLTWNFITTASTGDPAVMGAPYVSPGFQVVFNGNGTIKTINGSATAAPSLPITWNNGSTPTTVAVNIGLPNSTSNVTCDGGPFTINPFQIDGNVPSSLLSITTDDNGFLSANFAAGQTYIFGRLPLAKFTNPNGLQELESNVYQTTLQSGPYALDFPGTGGVGNILAGQLEMSTVDIASVFTDMMVDSMNYKSNLKSISTTNDLLQALERLGV